ncbi:MAG: biopolymer transporter ExbD [Pseudomonadota bacterium]
MRIHKFSRVSHESDIDLTPMLSIIFIMLMFFAISTEFNKNEVGIDVNSPPLNGWGYGHPGHHWVEIFIHADSTDQISINGQAIDLDLLLDNIIRLRAETPDNHNLVVIKLHAQSSANILLQIMDYARQAGVYTIALAE